MDELFLGMSFDYLPVPQEHFHLLLSLVLFMLVRAHPGLFSEETTTVLKTAQLKPRMIA